MVFPFALIERSTSEQNISVNIGKYSFSSKERSEDTFEYYLDYFDSLVFLGQESKFKMA